MPNAISHILAIGSMAALTIAMLIFDPELRSAVWAHLQAIWSLVPVQAAAAVLLLTVVRQATQSKEL